MSCFSSADELSRIRDLLVNYRRLPFSPDSVPGAIMESVLAHVRGATVLKTYDFVDVVRPQDRVGWQVKSTKAATPVTWKRAKIPGQPALIKSSQESAAGCQQLGDAIIAFCNEHAAASLQAYDIDEIGYCRLLVHDDGSATYFERILCTRAAPTVFSAENFEWGWSKPKVTKKKEQLPALHGIHKPSGEKWWAWHGLGENQLHFSGEKVWWPAVGAPNSLTFHLPSDEQKMSLEEFLVLIEKN